MEAEGTRGQQVKRIGDEIAACGSRGDERTTGISTGTREKQVKTEGRRFAHMEAEGTRGHQVKE